LEANYRRAETGLQRAGFGMCRRGLKLFQEMRDMLAVELFMGGW